MQDRRANMTDDQPKRIAELSDSELMREFDTIDVDADSDPRGDALLEEIKRRHLDI
jgi:hypothetical protein